MRRPLKSKALALVIPPLRIPNPIGWIIPKKYEYMLGSDRPLGDLKNDVILIKILGIQQHRPYASVLYSNYEKVSQYGPYARILLRGLVTHAPEGAIQLKWPRWYKTTKLFHGRPIHVSGRGFINGSELLHFANAINEADKFLTELETKFLGPNLYDQTAV